MGAAGTIGADQHFLSDRTGCSERQLRQCCSSDLDVVDSGVGTGVSGPKERSQRFSGAVVDERQQRMETKAPLEVRRSAFFLRMCDHEGTVKLFGLQQFSGATDRRCLTDDTM